MRTAQRDLTPLPAAAIHSAPARKRDLLLAVCSLAPPRADGACAWCGAALPARRRSWCSDRCGDEFWANHWWSVARSTAKRRDRYRCRRCGERAPKRPVRAKHRTHASYLAAMRAWRRAKRTARLEVNHIVPCSGKHGELLVRAPPRQSRDPVPGMSQRAHRGDSVARRGAYAHCRDDCRSGGDVTQSAGEKNSEDISALTRGVRLDLVIAVCALLISSLATAASFWQARVVETQTRVLQEQLGAQVWPYVGVSETLSGSTAKVAIENDGLGPAVLRSATAEVDGRPQGSIIDVMHAILGPNIVARKPRGENMGIDVSGSVSGAVLRPGDSTALVTFTSKRFAAPLVRAYPRLRIRVCYCAIIPGSCWQTDSRSGNDPQPVAACREIARDLLHGPTIDVLNGKF